MLWSILICTLSWRERWFLALLGSLLPQAEEFPGQVEVVALRNHGELLVNDYRQAMLNDPRNGHYISFIDDDDRVEACYVSKVVTALRLEPDVVGFTAKVTGCGDVSRSFFSIRNRTAFGTMRDGAFRQPVSSWSPIRTSLARQGSYIARGLYDDEAFAASVMPHLKDAREAIIPQPIMTYTGAHQDSCQSGGPGIPIGPLTGRRGPDERPAITSPCFRWFEGEVSPARPLPLIRQPERYFPDTPAGR